MRTERRAVWPLLGFVSLLSVPLAAQSLPPKEPCPTIDRATFDKIMQLASEAIAHGKSRAAAFRTVRQWCKAQAPAILFSTEERDCWHAVVGELPTLAAASPTPSLADQLSRLLAEPPCSTSDRAVFDEARRRTVDGLSSGKGRAEVWKAVRSWIKSRNDIPPKFQHCAKAIFDVEYQPYKAAADAADEAVERRRQQQERDEYSEWYALTAENQAMILRWRKARAAEKEPDVPRLLFTEESQPRSACPAPLRWTVRTHNIGDTGLIAEPARVQAIIDADTIVVSIGSHKTECSYYLSGSIRMPGVRSHARWKYRRREHHDEYGAHVTSIVVDLVPTAGLVSNADLPADSWGFMRITRTTTEFADTMYVVQPTGNSPATLMAISVPPTVLQAHGRH